MSIVSPEYFFDACAMIGKWHQRTLRFSSVDRLLGEMNAYRIRKALVYHSSARLYDFRKGNEMLDQELASHPELIPCYLAIPFTTGEMPPPGYWDQLLQAKGPFVFRILPSTHNFLFRSRDKQDFFAYVEEKRIPVFIDIDEFDLRDLIAVCRDRPGIRLILGNSGTDCLSAIYRELRKMYDIFEQFENLAMETSFLIGFREIEDVCVRYGARRLVFGSRMPFLEPGSGIARIQYAEISAEQKRQIAHENLEKWLGEVVT